MIRITIKNSATRFCRNSQVISSARRAARRQDCNLWRIYHSSLPTTEEETQQKLLTKCSLSPRIRHPLRTPDAAVRAHRRHQQVHHQRDTQANHSHLPVHLLVLPCLANPLRNQTHSMRQPAPSPTLPRTASFQITSRQPFLHSTHKPSPIPGLNLPCPAVRRSGT